MRKKPSISLVSNWVVGIYIYREMGPNGSPGARYARHKGPGPGVELERGEVLQAVCTQSVTAVPVCLQLHGVSPGRYHGRSSKRLD